MSWSNKNGMFMEINHQTGRSKQSYEYQRIFYENQHNMIYGERLCHHHQWDSEKKETHSSLLIRGWQNKINKDTVLTMASHPLMLLDAGDVRTNRNMRCSKGGTNYRKAEETCIIDHGEKNKVVYIVQ